MVRIPHPLHLPPRPGPAREFKSRVGTGFRGLGFRGLGFLGLRVRLRVSVGSGVGLKGQVV